MGVVRNSLSSYSLHKKGVSYYFYSNGNQLKIKYFLRQLFPWVTDVVSKITTKIATNLIYPSPRVSLITSKLICSRARLQRFLLFNFWEIWGREDHEYFGRTRSLWHIFEQSLSTLPGRPGEVSFWRSLLSYSWYFWTRFRLQDNWFKHVYPQNSNLMLVSRSHVWTFLDQFTVQTRYCFCGSNIILLLTNWTEISNKNSNQLFKWC